MGYLNPLHLENRMTKRQPEDCLERTGEDGLKPSGARMRRPSQAGETTRGRVSAPHGSANANCIIQGIVMEQYGKFRVVGSGSELHTVTAVKDLQQALTRSQERVNTLSAKPDAVNTENGKLRETARNYGRIETVLGREQSEAILQKAIAAEPLDKPKAVPRRKTEIER
jgi:hypothetical protein